MESGIRSFDAKVEARRFALFVALGGGQLAVTISARTFHFVFAGCLRRLHRRHGDRLHPVRPLVVPRLTTTARRADQTNRASSELGEAGGTKQAHFALMGAIAASAVIASTHRSSRIYGQKSERTS